jgi:single-stranded-DNA-specific exonuclease
MFKKTKWILPEHDSELIKNLSKTFNISETVAKTLSNRGISTIESADKFLNVKLSNLHDPFKLLNMEKTVNRIIKAFKNNEVIYGFGDYDVDGLTSLSILYLFLSKVYDKDKVFYKVPNRYSSGYGLNNETIKSIYEEGGNLIITVDCGISNVNEIAYANSLGLEVIVIDHHQIPPILPDAISILNPYLEGDEFPFKNMAAVGVTFNMLVALRQKMRSLDYFLNTPEINLKQYLDIVAIGTVADIVPLFDENRIFVKIGFEQMAKTQNIGLRALMEVSDVQAPIDTGKISFRIAPRINAAGRLNDATKVVDLFTTDDPIVAKRIALELDEENKKRQKIEQDIYKDILNLIDNKKNQDTAIIVADETWNPGVIGIVASKLVDRYNRPTFLFSVRDDIGRGSARSINNFDLYKNLSKFEDMFINYGGHKYAAGLSIKMEYFEDFKNKMKNEADLFFKDPDNLIQEILIDDIISPSDVSLTTYNELIKLAPFGHKNPEPILGMRHLFVEDAKIIKEKHLKARLSLNKNYFQTIGFNLSQLIEETSSLIDIVFSLNLNVWKGYSKLQLNLKDLKKDETDNFN